MEITFNIEICGLLEGVKKSQHSTVDTCVCSEGEKDLADSYEDTAAKIAVREMPIRDNSGKINSEG